MNDWAVTEHAGMVRRLLRLNNRHDLARPEAGSFDIRNRILSDALPGGQRVNDGGSIHAGDATGDHLDHEAILGQGLAGIRLHEKCSGARPIGISAFQHRPWRLLTPQTS